MFVLIITSRYFSDWLRVNCILHTPTLTRSHTCGYIEVALLENAMRMVVCVCVYIIVSVINQW